MSLKFKGDFDEIFERCLVKNVKDQIKERHCHCQDHFHTLVGHFRTGVLCPFSFDPLDSYKARLVILKFNVRSHFSNTVMNFSLSSKIATLCF